MADTLLMQWTESRGKALAEAIAINTAAGADGISGEDQTKVDALLARADKLEEQLTGRQELLKRSAALDATSAVAADVAAVAGPSGIDAVTAPNQAGEILRALQSPGTHKVSIDIGKAAAFHQNLALGMGARDIVDRAEALKRDYSTTTSTEGGYLIPTLLENSIYLRLAYYGGVRAAGADVLTTTTGATITWPRTVPYIPTSGAQSVAESAPATVTDASFTEIKLEAREYAVISYVPRALLVDEETAFGAFLDRYLGQAIAAKVEFEYQVGSGSGQAQGVFTAGAMGLTGASKATTATKNKILWTELFGVKYALDEAYLGGGSAYVAGTPGSGRLTWLMSKSTLLPILTLVDNEGRPLVVPAVRLGETDTLFGDQVVFAKHAPAISGTGGEIIAAMGDFSAGYIIRDVGTVDILTSSEFRFDKRQEAVQAVLRSDGKVNDPYALSYLVNKA